MRKGQDGKGTELSFCEAPVGPFRQKSSVPFFLRTLLAALIVVLFTSCERAAPVVQNAAPVPAKDATPLELITTTSGAGDGADSCRRIRHGK